MCTRDKDKKLSQLSSTQPSALLISSVNAVEITAVEVKHASQQGMKSEREKQEREGERDTDSLHSCFDDFVKEAGVLWLVILSRRGQVEEESDEKREVREKWESRE